MHLRRCAIITSLLIPITIYGQFFSGNDIVKIDPFLSVNAAHQGDKIDFALVVDVSPGYHINAHVPTEDFLIPTNLKFNSVTGITVDQIDYPEAKLKVFSFSESQLAVYDGKFIIYAGLSVSQTLTAKEVLLSGNLSYQGCDNQVCLAPAEAAFKLPLKIVNKDVNITSINNDIFSKLDHSLSQISGEKTNMEYTPDELRAKEIIEKGLPYAIIAFFILGLALNLTPCVYPVIPITVSYFGGQKTRDGTSPFFSALAYIIGIAIVFAILGLISGLAGKQWGFLFQNPWFIVIISLIILSMAASMFGAFEIRTPGWIMNRFGGARRGVVGALIMGLTVGVVITPCAAGIIIGLVGLVAKLGIVAKGTLLFFIMGLGLGLPYLILATFSGLLDRLPQSGVWMVWIRKFFGILLVGVAIYFIIPQTVRAQNPLGFLLGILTIFGGLLLGFLEQNPAYTKTFKRIRSLIGILFIVIGFILTFNSIQPKSSDIKWIKYNGQPIQELLLNGEPAILEFYADWCAPCKQMDHETFTNQEVITRSKHFQMIKIDCTSPGRITRALMNQFQVRGIPTIIFLNNAGKEVETLRIESYVDAKEFAVKMDKILNE